jgi:hypothetical protein
MQRPVPTSSTSSRFSVYAKLGLVLERHTISLELSYVRRRWKWRVAEAYNDLVLRVPCLEEGESLTRREPGSRILLANF